MNRLLLLSLFISCLVACGGDGLEEPEATLETISYEIRDDGKPEVCVRVIVPQHDWYVGSMTLKLDGVSPNSSSGSCFVFGRHLASQCSKGADVVYEVDVLMRPDDSEISRIEKQRLKGKLSCE